MKTSCFDLKHYATSDYQEYLGNFNCSYQDILDVRLRHSLAECRRFDCGSDGALLLRDLPWDSEVLGVAAARIELVTVRRHAGNRKNIFRDLINRALRSCRRRGIEFITARVSASSLELVQALEEKGFYTTDVMATLVYRPGGARPVSDRNIRPATRSDFAAVKNIACTAFGCSRLYQDARIVRRQADRFYRHLTAGIIDQNSYFSVYAEGGRIAGFCLGTTDSENKVAGLPLGYLWLIAVAPAAQGRAIGRSLFKRFMFEFSRQVKLIEVSTQIQNLAALRLYNSVPGVTQAAGIVTLHHWRKK